MNGSKGRIEYIDAMRGFTMLLVVFGHVLTIGLQNYSEQSVVYAFFHTFRMPMFFFISGYIAYKTTDFWHISNYILFLKKKSVVQLIPTLFFFILYGLVFGRDLWNSFLNEGVGIYWFCQALFEMFCIYYTIQLFCKYTSAHWFTVLILFVMVLTKALSFLTSGNGAMYHILLMHRVLPYFMYFGLGLICKKYNEGFLKLMKNDFVKAVLIIGFIGLFCLKYHHDFLYGDLMNMVSERLFLRVIGLFCVFSFFYNNAEFFSTNMVISPVMQFVGRRTLDIYLIHYFFIPDLACCNEFLSTNTRAIAELIFGFGFACIIIFFSLLSSMVIRNSEFLGHYLFGVKSDKYRY